MATETINELVYNFISEDVDMVDTFNGIYYILNDRKVNQPYAIIYQIDDPMSRTLLCADDEGQTRFGCDVFSAGIHEGLQGRLVFMNTLKKLQTWEEDSITIYNVVLTNAQDRSNSMDGLFNFNFESIISWRKN